MKLRALAPRRTGARLLIVLALGLAGCSTLVQAISGVQNFLPVSSLVDNVAFLPAGSGRRTPDSAQTTFVGPGVTAVEFTFLDSLDPASVAGFSPAANLELSGVSLDPLHPPFFNSSSSGLIRPYEVLTVPLAAPLPVGGPFHVRLVSDAAGNLLRTVNATNPFSGTYDVAFQVVSRSGTPPVVSRVAVSRGGNSVASLSTLDAATILSGSAHVFVPPHAQIEIDFSKKMRSPVPVLVDPAVPVPTTITYQGELLHFNVPTSGLSFTESQKTDPSTGATFTALTSAPTSQLDLGASYRVTIPSDTSLSIQSTFAQDESGLALVPNVSPTGAVPPVDFSVSLDVSGVLITSPADGSYLNANALSGPSIEVRGVALGGIPSQVSVFHAGNAGTIVGTIDTGSAGTSSSGAALEGWSATVPTSAFALASGEPVDGLYFISAGTLQTGMDIIQVIVDRSAPTVEGVSADSTLDLYADSDTMLPHACFDVLPSPGVDLPGPNDAVQAKLYLGNIPILWHLLGTSTTPILVPSPPAPGGTVRFCFDGASLPTASLVALENPLSLIVTDAAGNATRASFSLRIHGVIDRISPSIRTPGQDVLIVGRGLVGGTTASPIAPNAIAFDGSIVPLLHAWHRDGSGGPILQAPVSGTPGSLTEEESVTLRVPDFAASANVALVTSGLASRGRPLTICNDEPLAPLISPFGTTTFALDEPNGFPKAAFVGDLGLTGILRDPAPPPGGPDVSRAGLPIVFASDTAQNLVAWSLDPATGDWAQEPVAAGAAQEAFAAAHGPDGDVRVAYLARAGGHWQPYVASRSLAGGSTAWTPTAAGLPYSPTPAQLDPAIALAYAPDGRAAVAYAAPMPDGSAADGLWVSMETRPRSGVFTSGFVDGPGIGSVSAAFDSKDRLWVAYALRSRLLPSSETEDAALKTVVVRQGLFVPVADPDTRRDLGIGLAPSIAVDPVTDVASVAWLPAFRLLAGTAVRANEQESAEFATWTSGLFLAPGWSAPEAIAADGGDPIATPTPIGTPDEDPSATPTPVPFPQSENANVLVAHTSLRFTAEGTARFAYARPSGGLFLATRQPDGTWLRDLVETAASPGPTLGMALLGDSARIGYFDRRAAALRFYDEDHDRKLLAVTPETACSSDRYRRHSFTLSTDSFVDAHNDFVWTTASFLNPAALPLTDVFVSALTRDTTELRAVTGTAADFSGDHEDFILTPASATVPPATGTTLPILRFEYSDFPKSGPGQTRARIRAAVAVNILGVTIPQFVELTADDSTPGNSASACTCPVGTLCCPNALTDALHCDLAAMNCTSPFPAAVAPPMNQGQNLRDLAKTLPLVPVRQDASGGGATAFLSELDLTLGGIDVSAQGSDLTAGVVDLDLPVPNLAATARVTDLPVFGVCVPIPGTGNCVPGTEKTIDLTHVCGGDFDVGVSKPNTGVRIRIEGPPTAVQRDGSARFGMPILAGPDAFALTSGDLDVDLSDLDPCLDGIYSGAIVVTGIPLDAALIGRATLEHEIKSTISNSVKGRLRYPAGGLQRSFIDLARNMDPVLASPLLEFNLFSIPAFGLPVDGRKAVVLKIDADGRLQAVFEKGLFP